MSVMGGATDAPDELRVLRAQVESATTTAEHAAATYALAGYFAVRDPVAARPLLEQVIVQANEAGDQDLRIRARPT